MVVRPAGLAASILCLVVLAAGCMEDDPVLPEACKVGTPALLKSLKAAPSEVKLGDHTLANCMELARDAGDVQVLGASFVGAATELAARVRVDPNGPAATELGYLLGAARNGVKRTVGIHEETVRRMEQELLPLDTSTKAFDSGERAGRING